VARVTREGGPYVHGDSARGAARKASLAAAVGVALVATTAGCASGGSGLDAGARIDDVGPTMEDAAVDAGPPGSCTPACTGGRVCRGGVCVDPTADVDGDGVPRGEDCDDMNPAIGRLAERSCSSRCGTGVEQCLDGTWMPCTAPASCDCAASDPPRMVPCGFCGTQRQTCVDGRWTDDGTCMNPGTCTPGATEMGGACGMCGREVRTCEDSCSWGPWRCSGETGECVPGTAQTTMESCGNCGTRRVTRMCLDTCRFGPPEAGACTGEGPCAPGTTRPGECDRCSQQVCTSSCTWPTVCTLRPGNACEYRGGTNWRSCTGDSCTSGSCWQYCSASCQYFPCQNRP
jgi:hypothetical protein